MDALFTLLLILHILAALLMVLAILLQSGQAGGISGAFGGGGGAAAGNQSLFGGRGAATFLSKATAYLGAGFLLISFMLAYVQAHRGDEQAAAGRNVIRETLIPQETAPPPQTAPETGSQGAPREGGLLTPTGAAPEPGTGTEEPAEPPPAAPPSTGGSGGE